MRDLSKFEFLNLLGIWLFQRVSNLEVFPSFRIRANRGKHNIEKDIPFYQFPAKADPSVRLSPFCFPSAQSRDSDRNNNYPSPPIYIRSFPPSNKIRFHSARLVADRNYRSSDLSPPFFQPSYSLRILFLSPSFLLERRKGRESVGNGSGLLHKRRSYSTE